jgi:FG-GAP-like repeat
MIKSRECALLLRAIAAAAGIAVFSSRASSPAADAPPASIEFSEHLIAGGYAYAYGIAAVDIDGDGDLDLTSADYQPHNMLYWYENDKKGNFTRHLIQKDDPERLERHRIGDINGDGRPDVVIVENFYGDVKWFENPPNPKDGQLWKRHYITRGGLLGAYDVDVADFDRDGDLDVAASSWRLGNKFVWYENPGVRQDREWTAHVIDVNLAETRTIRAADFDRDGDMDLLGSVTGGGAVLWYENPVNPRTDTWKMHVIDLLARPAHGQPVDMDGDGDLDVVMAAGMAAPEGTNPKAHKIMWYENPGNPARDHIWKKHLIYDSFDQAFEAVAADLDGDGDIDVAATGWGSRGQLAWFENSGKVGGEWVLHMLKTPWPRANQVIVADLDGNGRPDLAAVAEHGSNEFRWWRNEGKR